MADRRTFPHSFFPFHETVMASRSCPSRPLYFTDKSGVFFGGVGGDRRQLLDKFKRPLFVPNHSLPHLWSASTAAARKALVSN